MTWHSLRELLLRPRTLLAAFIIAAIFNSVQLILLGTHIFAMPKAAEIPPDIMNQPHLMSQFAGQQLTQYNNYVIFKCSWQHLVQGTNLYGLYPSQHWDFYKYSPTFALFMGSISWLPDYVGLSVWNILNVIAVFLAVRMLPFTVKTQCLLLWFVFNELNTCLSNTQSNGLMCGLIVAAWACMEQQKMVWAALWLVAATYIKVYGIAACCLILFYPGKLRSTGAVILWMLIFALIPLLVTTPQTLWWQYENWLHLMVADASTATGLSVNGWLGSWFGVSNAGKWVSLTGIVLFFIPFTMVRLYQDHVYRMLMLASLLVWVIIFNHKAESSTYIIAVTGVGIWYFAKPARKWRTALLFLVLVFTSLSTTDFFPSYVRAHYMLPYKIKTFPCIVVWVVMLAEIIRLKKPQIPEKENKLAAAN